MNKLVFAVGLMFCASISQAHDVDMDSNSCDLDINGRISMTDQQLTVRLANNLDMLIDQDQDLYVDGHKVSLNKQQQEWVTQYYQGFYQAVPVTADIVNTAILLAGDAVGEVFGELFDDPNFADDLKRKLASLNQKVQQKLYAEDGSIHLQGANFEDSSFVDDAWEDEVESMVEEFVMSSVGRLMISLGSQMLSGNMDEFEQRMQRLGDDIETRVEAQALQVENKAQKLCAILKNTDEAENKLQQSIPELVNLNVFEIDKKHQLM